MDNAALFTALYPAHPPAPRLDEALERALEQGRAAWPTLMLPAEAFTRALARHAQRAQPAELEAWLEGLALADLWLATACALEVPGALEVFTRRYGDTLRAVARRFAQPQLGIEDLEQLWRARIFVSTPERPARIREYGGRGQLNNWVRVTGIRLFIDEARKLQRGEDEVVPFDGEALLRAPDSGDLELDFLKRTYRDAFKAAFAEGLAALSGGERTLLRQKVLGELNIDQLGQLYCVHRSTMARRLAAIRARLLKRTRGALMRRLEVDRAEFESIMALIDSHLDVSLTRQLRQGSHIEAPDG